MKKLNGFENAKIITGESKGLPKGGYVIKIQDCSEMTGNKNGRDYTYLSFAFDVAEGEYTDHFKGVWQNSTDENKKWRGVHNVFIPQEGDQYYEDNLNRFKTMIANIEESNPGYHWDWNEKQLAGKYVGIIYREKEFLTNDGEMIIITEPCGFRSVQTIRDGKYKVPGVKKLKDAATKPQSYTAAPEEKLPWE